MTPQERVILILRTQYHATAGTALMHQEHGNLDFAEQFHKVAEYLNLLAQAAGNGLLQRLVDEDAAQAMKPPTNGADS